MVRAATSNNRIVVALLALGALCLVAVVAGWAASRDRADDTERWADSVCGSLREWREEIEAAAESVPAGGDGAGSVTTLDDAYFDVRDATTELARDLRAIGAPDSEAGRAARDQLRQLAEQLDSLVNQLLNAAVSTEAIADAEQLRSIGDGVVVIVDELGGDDAELRRALRDRASCRALLRSAA
jgi:hypothetical protein